MIWLAATPVPVDPSMGVLASFLGLYLMWTHRSRFVPFWLPDEEWHRLERAEPGSGTRLEVVQPVPALPESTPDQEPDPAEDLQGELLALQGRFEAAMQDFTRAAESEWTGLEHQLVELHTRYQVVRGQLSEFLAGREEQLARAAERGYKLEPRVLPWPERALPEATDAPTEPPVELSGTGWSEPDPAGLRNRSSGGYFEYLGALAQPDAPASAENPRPYYREARPPGFVEIARGVVAGKRLLITECVRFLESAEGLWEGEGLALEPGGRALGLSADEVAALEKALWTLPEDLRARLGDLTMASDLGGPVDWEGRYRADEEGYPRSFACLAGEGRLALRADLASRPGLLLRALGWALGQDEPVSSSGEHEGLRWVEL